MSFDTSIFNSDQTDGLKSKYLTFVLGPESYGLEIRYVVEIIGMKQIHGIPKMPPFVKGVTNLRGSTVPVIDMRLRFDMPPREYDARTCIVVVRLEGVQAGLIVDTVSEVMEIPDEQIDQTPPISQTEGARRFMKGLGKLGEKVFILLNTPKLLFEGEAELLKEIASGE